MRRRVRTARLTDLPEIAEVARATDNPEEGAAADPRYAAHVLTRGRLVVAELGEDIVAFAGSIRVGAVDHLTDLFVRPEHQGAGFGGLLLEATWTGARARTTFSSSHAGALPLYVRAGMLPLWPLVYVAGDPAALPPPPGDLTVEEVPVDRAAVVEAAIGGGNRLDDYAFWTVRPAARVLTVMCEGRPVAAAATGGIGVDQGLSHLRVSEPDLAAGALSRVVGGLTGEATVAIPGPNPTLELCLAAGWRIVDVDYFMASSHDLVDPSVLFPHPGLL